MRAIVFDLFGTLTDPAVEVTRRDVVGNTAHSLEVPASMFWDELSASYPERIVGRHGNTRQTLTFLVQQCGATPSPETFERALLIHLEGARRLRAPRPGAIELLTELRRRGFRLAMLSDCSSEVAEGWADSPYSELIEVPVLSCQEGRRKPDPQLYATVTQRLAVPAESCWYVGDGGSRELSGARDAGMTPIFVTNSSVPEAASYRADADDFDPPYEVAEPGSILEIVGTTAS